MMNKLGMQQLLEIVRVHQEMGNYDKLLPILNILLKKDPNNSEYILWKLQALDALQDEILDFNLLHHYVNMRSSDVTGYLLLFKAYMAKNMVADALISLVFALSVDPDDKDCLYLFNKTLSDINPDYKTVKINVLTTNRIGHLAIEIEPWLRLKQNVEPDDSCLYLFISNVSSPTNVANQALYSLLKNYVHIIESEVWYNFYLTRAQLLDEQFFVELPYDIHSALRGKANQEITSKGNRSLINIYNNLNMALQLPPDDIKQGWTLLSRYNLYEKDKIVCLHVRDNHYLANTAVNVDFSYHDYRDVNIANYKATVESLIDKGYKVVRIGSSSNQRLNVSSNNYIDFCLDRDQENGDFLELLLISQCSFYIGALSGPYSVAALFDVPILLVNSVPFNPPYSKNTRFIPKRLIKSNEIVNVIDVYNGKLLSDKAKIPLLWCMNGNELKEHGYEYIENTSEEILLAVHEFEQQIIDGNFIAKVSDAQKMYQTRLPKDFVFKDSSALVCDSFLTKNPELF